MIQDAVFDLEILSNLSEDYTTIKMKKNKKHDIFKRDPATLYNYMYKEVEISTSTKELFKGRVYTVDPVSFSFMLSDCNKSTDSGVGPREILTLVVGHNIVDVKITDDEITQELKDKIDSMYVNSSSDSANVMDDHQVSERKAKLIEWFEANHISIEALKHDENVLTLNGLVEIRPPYTRDTCFCTNHLVLGKIIDLIDKMPK